MVESPANTVVAQAMDQAIIDSLGNTWGITQSGRTMVNGRADTDPAQVLILLYVNSLIWRQTTDLRWHCKRHWSDAWWPPGGTDISPQSGKIGEQTGQIERAIGQVMGEIIACRADFDAYKSWAFLAMTEVEDLVSAGAADRVAMIARLDEILAMLKAQATPTKIVLDIEHATDAKQAIPPAEANNGVDGNAEL
jgi:hypothetical protein